MTLAAFFYESEFSYIDSFLFILVVSVVSRLYLASSFKKNELANYSRYVNYYVIASFFVGVSWGFLTLIYYNLHNPELRLFLTIVNLALVTAAVGSLAVWIRAYLAFSLPQMFALMLAKRKMLKI